MQAFLGSSERGLVCEVGRIDDQGVAVPMTARASHPLANLCSQRRTPVEWNDPGVVHHFGEGGYVLLGLKNLIVVVVRGWQHDIRYAARDTSLPEPSIEP